MDTLSGRFDRRRDYDEDAFGAYPYCLCAFCASDWGMLWLIDPIPRGHLNRFHVNSGRVESFWIHV